MNKHALTYIAGVILLATMLFVLTLFQRSNDIANGQLLIAALLLLLATGSQLGKVLYKSNGEKGKSTSWYTPLLSFMFAGVLVLPPYMLVALVVIPHLAEWAIERIRNTPFLRQWYIQPFNIATHIICSLLAWQIYGAVAPRLESWLSMPIFDKLIASALAGLIYLIINHYLVGQAMVLACNVSWLESGVLDMKNAGVDAMFLAAGVGTSLLLQFTPYIVIPIILGLLYLQRRFAVAMVKSA